MKMRIPDGAAWLLWFASATRKVTGESKLSSGPGILNHGFVDEQGQCPPPNVAWLSQDIYFQIRDDVKAVRDVGSGMSKPIPSNKNERLQVRPFTATSTALSLFDDANLVLQFVRNGGTSYPLDISFEPNEEPEEITSENNGGNNNQRGRRLSEDEKEARKLQQDGWSLAASYLVERSHNNLVLDHRSMTNDDIDVQPIGLPTNNAMWYCEVVEFHFAPSAASDPTAGGSASVVLHDLMVAPFFEPKYEWDILEPHCELPVVSPCTNPDEICHAVNGQVKCVERPKTESEKQATESSMLRIGSSIHPLVQYEPPISGLSRDEYLEKYHCPKYASPVPPSVANLRKSFLYWVAGGSFLQASNAHIQIDQQDSTTTIYKFNDQFNREPILYAGPNGNLLERAEQWREDGQERRVIFYFDHNVGGGSPEEGGWSLSKLWVYNDQYDSQTGKREADWVYAKMEGLDISVPTSKSVFYCQSVEFDLDFFDHSFYSVNDDGAESASFTHNTDQSRNAGSFTMEHVYLMGYQDTDLVKNTACDLDEIYNPCDEFTETGRTFCHAKNGVVSCLDEPNGQTVQGSILPEIPTLRSFSPETSLDAAGFTSASLLCEAPRSDEVAKVGPDDLSNVTLHWQSSASYLYATDANIVYPNDGTVLQFQDQLLRETCLSHSSAGDTLSRDSYWWEGNIERQLTFGFVKYDNPSGWSLTWSAVLQNEYEPERMHENFPSRFENNNGIIGASRNTLFHCDYVQFDYSNPVTGKVEATFTGWDFVIGSYMDNLPREGSVADICNLPVYNPCLEETPDSPYCQFQDGALSCHSKRDGIVLPDPDVAFTRSATTSPRTLGSLGVGPCRRSGDDAETLIPNDNASDEGKTKSGGWSASGSSTIIIASVGVIAVIFGHLM